MNQEDQLFEDLEYLFIIQSFNIKLERFTERGLKKLHPSEVMAVRLGRSKNQFIHNMLLSINNELDELSIPKSAFSPSLKEFKCGRSIISSYVKSTYYHC